MYFSYNFCFSDFFDKIKRKINNNQIYFFCGSRKNMLFQHYVKSIVNFSTILHFYTETDRICPTSDKSRHATVFIQKIYPKSGTKLTAKPI